MQNFFQSISNTFNAIPDIIVGILLLVVAYLVALLAKKLIVALFKKLDLEKKISKKKADEADSKNLKITDVIGKIVFLIVFILFLPSILNKFGLNAITAPIVNMINTFIQYIPNIVAAAIILFVGFFVANIIRQVVVAAIDITKVEKLQAKITRGKSTFNISKFAGTLVYVIIAIVVVICALNVLNIPAISVPAASLLNDLVNAIPSIILAVLVFFAGIFIANLVYSVIYSILDSMNLDEKSNKLVAGDNKEIKPIAFSKIICEIVRVVIIVLFFVEAINALNFDILTGVGKVIIGFMPAALVTVLVILAAYVVCRIVDAKFNSGASKCIVKTIKAIVITVAAFIGLSQLGIAPAIVNTAFIVIIIALGVAFALAVGLGGRKFVEDNLQGVKIINKDKKNEEEK